MQQTVEARVTATIATKDRCNAVGSLKIVIGAAWALLTVVIWSAWPSYTRLSIVNTLSTPDLVALRYAVGGIILLPILIRHAPQISSRGWREGLILAFFQGAPLALLVTLGVRFAPAGHMAALSPGLLPLFAAIIGFLFFDERLSSSRIVGLGLIVAGAVTMAGVSFSILSNGVWRGDLLFICTGSMGAVYAVRMRRSGLSAMQGAALIGVYSMLGYLPVYWWFWLGAGNLAHTPVRELAFQAFYQGVLMGAVSLFSLSRAIVMLGATRAAAFISLVPVLGTLLGVAILNEWPSAWDIAAVISISTGVLLAAGIFPAFARPSKAEIGG